MDVNINIFLNFYTYTYNNNGDKIILIIYSGPEELIHKKGEYVDKLYIIIKGEVEHFV